MFFPETVTVLDQAVRPPCHVLISLNEREDMAGSIPRLSETIVKTGGLSWASRHRSEMDQQMGFKWARSGVFAYPVTFPATIQMTSLSLNLKRTYCESKSRLCGNLWMLNKHSAGKCLQMNQERAEWSELCRYYVETT